MATDHELVRQLVEQALEKTDGMKATETGDRAPDELGTVTGWRAWRVDRVPDAEGRVLLYSAAFEYAWVPFEKARASCENCKSTDPRDKDCTPGNTCSCGFYSARSLAHLRSMNYHAYNDETDDGSVKIVGRVANWGKVVPGTQGWRAEYAYPERLFVPFEVARHIARPVMETYGVPVTLMNLLDPDAKPNKKDKAKRSLGRVLEPRRAVPKFLEEYHRAHRMEGFEDVEDGWGDDVEDDE
jgi:hypothetical protein